ncbi:uncharacterized protein SAPINGB_P006245 [Magnusiomyces paraingens]|uniref:Uncharacterized protein n=1 Tax=Magnusiomyces paraingens TaxID=2606893 RepID=A0A5E8C5Y0_9ASCO|nr:uncharacterized protein SAPINGB_P006245 [Saprochaete ingens]VVT58510.1 unnamed protein product [Saprochaete ingens]
MSESKLSSTNEEYHISPHPNHDFIASSQGICRVLTSDTHVQLGGMTFHKDEFMRAFEGYLNPGFSKAPTHKFGNPVPMGVASFCIPVFIMSLVNLNARGVSNGQGMFGIALFYAGLIELVAGMWCIALENAWAGTLLSSFAGFWFSYSMIIVDVFGISSSYSSTGELSNFVGFLLLAFSIFSTIMWILTFRSTWVLCTMMFFVALTHTTLCASKLAYSASVVAADHLTKAAGVFGIITSCFGFYIIYEGLATNENALFVPPVLLMPSTVTGREKVVDDEHP